MSDDKIQCEYRIKLAFPNGDTIEMTSGENSTARDLLALLAGHVAAGAIGEARGKLKAAAADPDTEGAHAEADEALTDLLAALGFDDIVALYDKVGKWYA